MRVLVDSVRPSLPSRAKVSAEPPPFFHSSSHVQLDGSFLVQRSRERYSRLVHRLASIPLRLDWSTLHVDRIEVLVAVRGEKSEFSTHASLFFKSSLIFLIRYRNFETLSPSKFSASRSTFVRPRAEPSPLIQQLPHRSLVPLHSSRRDLLWRSIHRRLQQL